MSHLRTIYEPLGLFFLPKIKTKGDNQMFSDEILERIFLRKELQDLSIEKQSKIIHAIEEVIEE